MAEVVGEGVVVIHTDDSDAVAEARKAGEKAGDAFSKGAEGSTSKGGQSAGAKFAKNVAGFAGKALKVGVGVIGTAAGGVLATSLFGGFQRLQRIDNAEAMLRGLGKTTGEVKQIMDMATAAVDGTRFSLDEAAQAASMMTTSGIKMAALPKTLDLIASAAALGNTSMQDMTAIFQEAAARGTVTGETLYSLTQRGINAAALWADATGMSMEQANAYLRSGAVSFEEFTDTVGKQIGDAAKVMGGSFTASVANLRTAFSRLGASVLDSTFQQIAPLINTTIIPALKSLQPVLAGFGETLGGAVQRAIDALGRFDFGDFIRKIQPLIDAVQFFAGQVVAAVKEALPGLVGIGKALAPLVGAAVVGGLYTLGIAVRAVGEAIGFLGDHRTIFKIIAGLVTAVFVPAMVKSARASIASSAASVKAWVTQTAAAASSAAETAAIAGLYVLDWIKMAAGAVVNGAIVIGQWLAMAATAVAQAAVMAAAWLVSLGPVTLVIAAIVAVGVALALLWAKSQKFRDIVTGAFNAVKVAAQAVFGWIKSNWPLLLAILAGPIGLAVLAIARNWDKIKAGFSNALAAIKSAVAKGMAAVGAAISAGLNSAVNYVRGLPAKIAAFAGDMLAKGKHLGSSLINGLLDGLKGAGGMVSDLAASIKGAINSALHLPVVIKGPGPLPDFKIPAFAAGTRNFAGGYALVGERGPEVVRLPRGTDVFPAGATQQMLGGSTAGSAMTAADARLIAQELAAVLGAPRIVNVTVPTDDPTAAAMAVVNRLATV